MNQGIFEQKHRSEFFMQTKQLLLLFFFSKRCNVIILLFKLCFKDAIVQLYTF